MKAYTVKEKNVINGQLQDFHVCGSCGIDYKTFQEAEMCLK